MALAHWRSLYHRQTGCLLKLLPNNALGGILLLEAKDLNHAIQLMSKHPGVRGGPFEIRPAADLTDLVRASERRRSARA